MLKTIILGTALLVATHSFASEIVSTQCRLKSSTWPVLIVRNELSGSMEPKPFELSITQEDPASFVRDSGQNGLDPMFPLTVSLSDNAPLEGIMPSSGLKSGTLTITPSKFLKRRVLRLGLISEEVIGVLEIKGDIVGLKKFDAQLVTVSKSGSTATAALFCTNIKN